jgi:hypothetical protein
LFAGPQALTDLYQLTYSEAELVRLLATGLVARRGGRQARREPQHRAESPQARVREDGHESARASWCG